MKRCLNAFSIELQDDTRDRFKYLQDGDVLKLRDVNIMVEESEDNYWDIDFVEEMKYLFLDDAKVREDLLSLVFDDSKWGTGYISYSGFAWSLDMFEYANTILTELI